MQPPITIGALSRATQIPVETLRTWERRYRSPAPIRKPSGHRLYPVAAIEQLRRVALLLERGHRPAELLGMSVPELEALLDVAGDPQRPGRTAHVTPGVVNGDSALETLMAAARSFDREALLAELQSHWARRGPLSFLEEISAPFLTRLGDEWRSGEIEVRHEHFASATLGDFLRAVREPFDARARGPRVVAATPPAEHHEGGLLMASLILAMRGRRLLYLGPSTPVAEIAATARQSRVECVTISIASSMAAPRARRFLTELRDALPRVAAIWVGGSGAPPGQRGVERFETLVQLDERLLGR